MSNPNTKKRKGEEEEEDPLVELSVSGTCFTVRKALLQEHDWVLSKMVDSQVPWALFHQGRYYLDADPTSFRWVLHFTRCQSLPQSLGKVELETLKTLADFLCFQALVDHTSELLAKLEKGAANIRALETKIHQLEPECKRLKALEDKLDHMDGARFECEHGAMILVPTGSPDPLDRSKLVCPVCGNSVRFDYIGMRRVTMHKTSGFLNHYG